VYVVAMCVISLMSILHYYSPPWQRRSRAARPISLYCGKATSRHGED